MTTTKTVVFDIETAPLPESELQGMMPEFSAPSNWKDPDKIKAHIEEQKKKWVEEAALSALTGRVLAIGVLIGDEFICIADPAPEAQILHEFWDMMQLGGGLLSHMVGFNIFQFDLPFLIRRSWKMGVTVPLGIRRGRYWGDQITDLRDVWQCGDRQAHVSLDSIAKHLDVGAKTGSGADFSKLWAIEREKAMAYLKNDLELTAAIAKKFGVM